MTELVISCAQRVSSSVNTNSFGGTRDSEFHWIFYPLSVALELIGIREKPEERRSPHEKKSSPHLESRSRDY